MLIVDRMKYPALLGNPPNLNNATRDHSLENATTNHETGDEGRCENLAAILLTLPIRIPVGDYFECAKTLESQESSASDQIEVIASSDTAESFTGSHPRRKLEYLAGRFR